VKLGTKGKPKLYFFNFIVPWLMQCIHFRWFMWLKTLLVIGHSSVNIPDIFQMFMVLWVWQWNRSFLREQSQEIKDLTISVKKKWNFVSKQMKNKLLSDPLSAGSWATTGGLWNSLASPYQLGVLDSSY